MKHVTVPRRLILPDFEGMNPEELIKALGQMKYWLDSAWAKLHDCLSHGGFKCDVLGVGDSDDVDEGGFQMVYDTANSQPKAFAKINGALKHILNFPQSLIGYAAAVQNNATGNPLWTFPQGGFANANVYVATTVEGPAAHVTGMPHIVYQTQPTTTTVQFYVDEVNPVGGTVAACTNTSVYVNAIAVGYR